MADEQFHYLPVAIHWGRGAREDSSCASETPARRRRNITAIEYPNWKRITGSVSFERMNADTLTDIVFYLWGRDEDGDGRNGRVATRDSLRALVIFGQVSLDEAERIDLAAIAPFQSDPYFAMELAPGVDLRDERKRDLSGTPSYQVKRLQLDVRRKKDTAEHGPLAPPLAGVAGGVAGIDDLAEVRVYPNPTAGEARIEAERLPAGTYTIEILAVNGTVALRQDVVVSQSRGLLRALDARALPSGYYLLRLHRDAAGSQAPSWDGSYPIIITR